MLVSQLLLWAAVIVQGVLIAALARQVGILHERIAPAGALTLHQKVEVGEVASPMTVTTIEGVALEVGGRRDGRSQLLFFASPDCPVCKSLLPVVRSAARAESDWLDVVLAGDGTKAAYSRLIAEYGLGGEAELTARIADWFQLHAGAGALSTKILQGTVSGVDVVGHKLANAPSFTFNVGPDLTLARGSFGTISVHPSLAYQSSQYFEVINEPILKQKGYALLDAHVDYESADGHFTASGWVKNAAQQFYFTSRVDLLAGFGFIYNHIGNPRTYGVTLGYKF